MEYWQKISIAVVGALTALFAATIAANQVAMRPMGGMGGSPQRTIYDQKNSNAIALGTVARTEGQKKVKDPAVNEAYDGFGATYRFFWDVYGRNSIGGALNIISAPLGAYLLSVIPMQGILGIDVGTALLAVSILLFPHVAGSAREDADRQVPVVARVTLLMMAYFLPSYPLGALADRVSRKKLLTVGLLINASGFVGLSFDDATPDHSTISVFRKRLRDKGHGSTLFDKSLEILRSRGLVMNRGTLIDATGAREVLAKSAVHSSCSHVRLSTVSRASTVARWSRGRSIWETATTTVPRELRNHDRNVRPLNSNRHTSVTRAIASYRPRNRLSASSEVFSTPEYPHASFGTWWPGGMNAIPPNSER